ncbi:MAG: DUF3429 domain-containing protein [Pseudomonadota bacterium]
MTDKAPALPLLLTLAGILPFISLAALSIYVTGDGNLIGEQSFPVLFLLFYAATILSFLGGIRWGAALLAKPFDSWSLGLSVLPSLAAWAILIGVMLTSAFSLALFAFAALFAIQLVWDRLAWQAGKLPVWFRVCRYSATTGAILSLLAAGIAIQLA